MVTEFHRAFALPIAENPAIPPADICLVRVQLGQEELSGLTLAMLAGDVVRERSTHPVTCSTSWTGPFSPWDL